MSKSWRADGSNAKGEEALPFSLKSIQCCCNLGSFRNRAPKRPSGRCRECAEMHQRKLLSEAADNRVTPVVRGFVCIVRPREKVHTAAVGSGGGLGSAAFCYVEVTGGIFIFLDCDRLRNAPDLVVIEGVATARRNR
jgi:hypothetical protein